MAAIYPYVILGGGMVAGYAAKELAALGALKPGRLLIVSSDESPPYERPPLSKGVPAGKKDAAKVFINANEFYQNNAIEIRLNTEVETIDPVRGILRTRAQEEISFQQLVIATGGRPRKLDVEGGDLGGVCYLRSLRDSLRIKTLADDAKRAVVIGGGFISMEIAAVLTERAVETTLVFPGERVWSRVFTPEISSFFQDYYRKKGVSLIGGAKAARFEGKDRVQEVVLDSGKRLPADLVVAGIGIEPETRAAEGTTIAVDNGIVVNEFLETSMPGIFAAGDVANYYDVLFQKRRRVEHWDNAVSQAQHIARALAGDRKSFVHVPYFFSDEFDLSYEFWGDAAGPAEVVYRGRVEAGSFSAWWLKDDCVAGAFVLNRPDEERDLAPKWIESRKQIGPDRLRDESRALAEP